MSRTGLITPDWYEAPPVKVDGTHYVLRARTPTVKWIYRRGPEGDFARWILWIIQRYEKPSSWWPLLKTPEIYVDLRTFRVSFAERLAGLALTAYIVLRAAR